jgi:L-lactate dehydrogenase complex protein LldE
MKVDLFIPCLVDQFFPGVGVATVKILRRVGCDVSYSKEQTCCGQPAFNMGYRNDARFLAERFIKIFDGAEYIVAPSGSCVSMVKVFYDELGLPRELKTELDKIKSRIYELSEFLVDFLKITDLGAKFQSIVSFTEF